MLVYVRPTTDNFGLEKLHCYSAAQVKNRTSSQRIPSLAALIGNPAH